MLPHAFDKTEYQESMQDQTPSSKWWKRFASLTMTAFSTILEMNFMEVWQSLQTHGFLIMCSWVAGALLMRPKCNSQFLTMPTWMEHLFFFLYIMQHKFIISNIPCLMHQPSQSLQFCTNFSNLRVVLILHHKCMHLINSLWCRCDLAVSSHLFPFSAVQHSHWDPSCQQQHVCLIASHNLQHFQAPVQELILQHVLPSPHYLILQAQSKAIHTATFGLQKIITLVIFSASCRWQAQQRRSTMQV